MDTYNHAIGYLSPGKKSHKWNKNQLCEINLGQGKLITYRN